ncbi:uncharacterized protein LOC111897081 [Lactuca sativa]|uniref:uncharacterized protein LOC111897081 n=1 Tax=Lactuca sativa TaxID=4236 RepID=UPI000CD7E3FF|nr:uncharacterized protein LOC111897081 [Lactuca sativa]
MNVLSLNVRGIGEAHKQSWVKNLCFAHRISLACLQESQLGLVSSLHLNIRNCWASNNLGYEIIEASGRSGGIITIWDDGVFMFTDSIKARHFLIVFGRCVGKNTDIAIVNVYAPQGTVDKRKLWEDLAQIKANRVAMWIFTGDFNTVRNKEERINSRFCHVFADDFNHFIYSNALTDLRMGGSKFTYFKPEDGGKLSKLDRFLVCDKFMDSFPGSAVTTLPRDLSDHCPIVMKTDCEDFGPRPFKFFNSWMYRTGFNEVVLRAWTKFRGYGYVDSFLATKLRLLKAEIKKWRDLNFDKENGELIDCRKKSITN